MAELMDLVGKHILSGIEVGSMEHKGYWGNTEIYAYIKFTLDGVNYLATEDPADGYRSYMNELETSDTPCKIRLPNIEVCCRMREDDEWMRNDVLEFLDVLNGKKILAVGTENYDDYYPYCVLEYTPENMSCNDGRVSDG